MIDFSSSIPHTTDTVILFPQIAETQSAIHPTRGNQVRGYGVESGHVVVNDSAISGGAQRRPLHAVVSVFINASRNSLYRPVIHRIEPWLICLITCFPYHFLQKYFRGFAPLHPSQAQG